MAWCVCVWGGGGGECTCDNVGRQRTGQSASSGAADAAATEQASDLVFVSCSVCNHGFLQLLLFVLVHGATE